MMQVPAQQRNVLCISLLGDNIPMGTQMICRYNPLQADHYCNHAKQPFRTEA